MSTPSHPTESTPLTPSNNTQSYQTSHPASHSSHSSHSSSDSGGGYISGSGRRESILDKPKTRRKPSRIPFSQRTSSQRTPSEHGGPLSTSIQWASTSERHERALSPAIAVSPGQKGSNADGQTTSTPGNDSFLRVESRRRSGEGSYGKSPPAASMGREASRAQSRDLSGNAEGDGKEEGSWFQHLAEKYGAIELDNKGSVARDHLALERTFLAWLRTSLAFASIGIGITQLFRLNTTLNPGDSTGDPSTTVPLLRLRTVGKPLGTTFLGISIVILFVGWRRYFEAQYWIIRGKFPASRGSVFLVTFVAAALIVVSLVVVVIVGKGV